MKYRVLLLFALVVLGTAGCGKKQKEFAQNNVEWPEGLDDHLGMVQYLAALQEQYFQQPENRYASALRAERMLERLQKEAGDPSIVYEVAFECLSAGKTTETIHLMEEALQQNGNLSKEQQLQFKKLLAIAYLRYGEQQNCISNHVAQSCILPIAPEAMYTEREATIKAYDVYTQLAQEDKTDLTSVFLLNVAAMNLGRYPDSLPEALRIPPAAFESEVAFPYFENVAIPLDLDVISASGGAITEDFDNDGFIDIVTSSWFLDDQLHYYHNNGDGTFTEQTDAANLTGITGGLNLLHADYNKDGFRDIFIPRGGWWNDYGKLPNSLLRNNGDGTFSDVTRSSGLFSLYPTQTAVFADFNNDGWLDLFVGNETRRNTEKYPCELFISNGDGTFTEHAKAAGVNLPVFAKGVVAGDYDNDGWMDIAISSQGQDNFLLRNETGAKGKPTKFKDVSKQAGITGPVKSFPLTFLDYNNDGWEDLIIFTYDAGVSDYDNAAYLLKQPLKGEVSVLYKNNGNGTFTNLSGNAGIEVPMAAMGFNYGDINNDGWIDLYVGTGTPEYTSLVPNKMFLNNNGTDFSDITTAGGFGHLQKGHGIGFADLDNDGDQDIYEDMGGGYQGDAFQGACYLNPGNPNNWITLLLEGTDGNRDAIGARVKIAVRLEDGSERLIFQTVRTGGSFGSASLQLETGLANATSIKEITIQWPGGTTAVYSDVPVNSFVKITEGKADWSLVNRLPVTWNLRPTAEMDHSMHEMH